MTLKPLRVQALCFAQKTLRPEQTVPDPEARTLICAEGLVFLDDPGFDAADGLGVRVLPWSEVVHVGFEAECVSVETELHTRSLLLYPPQYELSAASVSVEALTAAVAEGWMRWRNQVRVA